MFDFTHMKFQQWVAPGVATVQARYWFANGYGISVIRGPSSYGGSQGLYELAVIERARCGDGWTICYDTPITDDVLGWLTPEMVTEYGRLVEALPEGD